MIEQGWTTSVREALTPKHLEMGPMPPARPVPLIDTEKPVVVERLETPGTVNFDLAPQRYYTIVGVSESRNRRGPFAGPIQVALIDPLSPPEKLEFSYTAEAISLTWPSQPEDLPGLSAGAPGAKSDAPALSAGAQGAKADPAAAKVDAVPASPPLPVLDRETDATVELYADLETDGTADVLVAAIADKIPTGAKPKPRPVVAAAPAAPRFGYNVYESGAMGAAGALGAPTEPAPNAPIAPAAPIAPVKPLNAAMLTAPGFSDPRVEFGTERCYIVRRVLMAGAIPIESAPSTPACVTPVDTFPPAAPKSLAHIAAGNGVSLIWEANAETDLGGYLVLRGEAPGDKLSPLTPAPITDTSFLDTTVRRGRTYVYEVVAVDQSMPPNQSPPSNRVEETIR